MEFAEKATLILTSVITILSYSENSVCWQLSCSLEPNNHLPTPHPTRGSFPSVGGVCGTLSLGPSVLGKVSGSCSCYAMLTNTPVPFTHTPCRPSKPGECLPGSWCFSCWGSRPTHMHAESRGSTGGCENIRGKLCSVECKHITVSYRGQLKVVFLIVHLGKS